MFQIFITVMEIGKLSRPVTHTGPHWQQSVASEDLQIAHFVSNMNSLNISHQFKHVEPTWQQRHKLLRSSFEIQFFLWVDTWHKNQVLLRFGYVKVCANYYSLLLTQYLALALWVYHRYVLALSEKIRQPSIWTTWLSGISTSVPGVCVSIWGMQHHY